MRERGGKYLVENIRGKDFFRHTPRQILNPLAPQTALNGRIVAVRLGIRLFQQRQPRLLRVLALRKVQRVAVGLEDASIRLLRVPVLDLVKDDAVVFVVVVVCLGEV